MFFLTDRAERIRARRGLCGGGLRRPRQSLVAGPLPWLVSRADRGWRDRLHAVLVGVSVRPVGVMDARDFRRASRHGLGRAGRARACVRPHHAEQRLPRSACARCWRPRCPGWCWARARIGSRRSNLVSASANRPSSCTPPSPCPSCSGSCCSRSPSSSAWPARTWTMPRWNGGAGARRGSAWRRWHGWWPRRSCSTWPTDSKRRSGCSGSR